MYPWLPSTAVSSTPVTVTVWAVLQLEEENRIEEGETVPSVVSELLIAIETFADDWLFKFTVKVAVPPASVVEPEIALMTKTPEVEPESPESPPVESTSLSLVPTLVSFKSFCSLQAEMIPKTIVKTMHLNIILIKII